MSETLIFVRHGSLPSVYSNSFVGVHDIDLSDEGRADAAAVGRWLARQQYGRVFSGTLSRVRHTREIASESDPRLREFIADDRLNELDFGDWSLLRFDILKQQYGTAFEQWNMGMADFTFPNGENIGHFMERTRSVMEDLIRCDAETAVVFSHGGVLMSLIADAVGLPRRDVFRIWLERGGVALIRRGKAGALRLSSMFRPADCE